MTGNGSPAVHCGTFDAETLWRDDRLAKLPALPADRQSLAIVEAMEELLFLFCREGDRLLLRKPMNGAHVDYLRSVGFPIEFVTDVDSADRRERGGANDSPQCRLEPFAVLHGLDELARRYGLRAELPDIEVVKKVNSKRYSCELKSELGLEHPGRIVSGSEELGPAAADWLSSGAVLVKDPFGVSGKGNLLVQSAGVLERIAAYLASQEKKGKTTLLIIEPLLAKKTDFSCQFSVGADGSFRLESVQQVINNDFAYGGSAGASPELLDLLARHDYFETMREVARRLSRDGYFGPACVDSMVLRDGSVAPIVEINARKSMSLLKKHLDDYREKSGSRSEGKLSSLAVACDGEVTFEILLTALEQEDLLFVPGRGGILPLGANTFDINRTESRRYRGRLYFSAAAENAEERDSEVGRLKQLLRTLGAECPGE